MKEKNTFKEVHNNYKSSVGKEYSDKDVLAVWDAVSHIVEDSLQLRRAVMIKDLGTFTLSQWRLLIGAHKYIEIKKPVFILAEKLVQRYNLKPVEAFTTGKIPVIMLNISAVASQSGKPRRLVENCVLEAVQAFTRMLSQNQNVEFPFVHIGKLQVRNKQVQMKFYKDFFSRIDSSNEKFKSAKQWQGTTEASLLSGPGTPLQRYRPTQGFHAVLPIVGGPQGAQSRRLTKRTTFESPDAQTKSSDKRSLIEKARQSKFDCGHPECTEYELDEEASVPLGGSVVEKANEKCKEGCTCGDPDCTYDGYDYEPYKRKGDKSDSTTRDGLQDAPRPAVKEYVEPGEPTDLDVVPDPTLCLTCQRLTIRGVNAKPLSEKDRMKQKAEERILELAFLKEAGTTFMKEWEEEAEKTRKCKETMQYNLDTAFIKKEEDKKKPKEVPASYILCKRPDSKKGEKLDVLDDLKEHRARVQKLNQERQECFQEERVALDKLVEQLANEELELALEREAKKKEYSKQLDLQIETKKAMKEQFPDAKAVCTDLRGIPSTNKDPTEGQRERKDIQRFQLEQFKMKQAKAQKLKEETLEEERQWLQELKEEAAADHERDALIKAKRQAETCVSWDVQMATHQRRRKAREEFFNEYGYLLEEIHPRCRRCQKRLGR